MLKVAVFIIARNASKDSKAQEASVVSQTYAHCTAIYCAEDGHALHAAIAASDCDYFLVLYPTMQLHPDAVARYLALIARARLDQAVLYADFAYGGKKIPLGYCDPISVALAIEQGYLLQPTTVFMPKTVWHQQTKTDASFKLASYNEAITRLARHWPFVYLDAVTVSSFPFTCAARARFIAMQYLKWLHVIILPKAGSVSDKMQARRIAIKQMARWFRLLMPESLKRAVKYLQRRPANSHVGFDSRRLDFDAIYHQNGFKSSLSRSGQGSTLFQTRHIREELPALLRAKNIRSLLDIPCGDFAWMQHIDWQDIQYIGADIVPALIADNREKNPAKHQDNNPQFLVCDLLMDTLPVAELIFCRDCLVHLPFCDIEKALGNIVSSKASWLLTTHFTRDADNQELDAKGWRALNLQKAPFYFPPPEHILIEGSTEAGGAATDKTLALWHMDTLRRALADRGAL